MRMTVHLQGRSQEFLTGEVKTTQKNSRPFFHCFLFSFFWYSITIFSIAPLRLPCMSISSFLTGGDNSQFKLFLSLQTFFFLTGGGGYSPLATPLLFWINQNFSRLHVPLGSFVTSRQNIKGRCKAVAKILFRGAGGYFLMAFQLTTEGVEIDNFHIRLGLCLFEKQIGKYRIQHLANWCNFWKASSHKLALFGWEGRFELETLKLLHNRNTKLSFRRAGGGELNSKDPSRYGPGSTVSD